MAPKAQAVEADDVDETPEPSLRETIENARDEVIDAQVEARPRSEAGDEPSTGPLRDDSGRFTRRARESEGDGQSRPATGGRGAAAGAQDAVPAGAPDGGGGTQPVLPTAPGSQAPGPDPSLLAPQGWTPAAKGKWSTLPPDVRAEITRRETEMHRALSRQDEERQYGKQFGEIAQANAAIIQRAGVHPLRLFSDFLGIMRTLNSNDGQAKAALIRDVAMRNGIDLRAALGGVPAPQNPHPGAPQGGQAPSRDPLLLQIANELAQEKAERARLAQEERERAEQATLNEIIAFRSQPDAPYFDAVKDQMVALLQANAAQTLKEAYDQACWARPDIRAELIKQQAVAQAQSEAKRRRAELARAKGGSVRGGSGSVPDSAARGAERSLREELQANFAEARSRV